MEEKEVVLKRAKNAVLSRDFSLALRIYDSLLKEEPDNKEYLSCVGNIYEKTNSDAKALGYFQRIIKNSPNDFDALNHIGGIFRRLKMYNEAVIVLKKALATGKDTAEVNYNLGFTYKLMGKTQEAITCFESAITENPVDALAYNQLGLIYFRSGDFRKSITIYKTGLQIDTNHPILQYNLAKSYEAVNEIANASSAYESALKAKPGWVDAAKDYASLLLKEHRAKAAFGLVKKLLELHHGRNDLTLLLGKVYFAQNDYIKAEETLNGYIHKNPHDASAFALIAEIYEAQKKYKEAEEAIAKAQSLCHEEDILNITELEVKILLSAENYEEAYSKLVLISDNKASPSSLDLQGQMAICTDKEEILDRLRAKIIGLNKDYLQFYTNWGFRFMQKGKYREARKYFRKHISFDRKSLMTWLYLGMVEEKLGALESAAEDYMMVLNIDSTDVIAKERLTKLSDHIQDTAPEEDQSDYDELLDVTPEIPENSETAESEETEKNASENQNEKSARKNDEQSLAKVSKEEEANILHIDGSKISAFDEEQKSLSQKLLEGEELSDFGYVMPEEKTEEDKKTEQLITNPKDSGADSQIDFQNKEAVEDERKKDSAYEDNILKDEDDDSFNKNLSENANPASDFSNGNIEDENISESVADSAASGNGGTSTEQFPENKAQGDDKLLDYSQNAPDGKTPSPFQENSTVSDMPISDGEDEIPPLGNDIFSDNDLENDDFSSERENSVPSSKNPSQSSEKFSATQESKSDTSGSSEQNDSATEKKFNDVLEKAEKAAEKAWEAAQTAADAASTVDKAEDFINQMTEDATKKLQDVAEDIQNRLEESSFSKELTNNEDNESPAPDVPPEDEAKNSSGEQDAFGKALNSDEEPKCAFSAIGSENEENFSSDNDNLSPQAESEPDANEELFLSAKLTPYETLLNQVSQILPLVENMLINKEDAAKFSKEVALFNSIKEMSASLPAELKEDFMTGRMRILLDFIIAKLSGKPGLLRTTFSLKKSGIFGKEEEETLADAERQAQNYSEKDLVKKVLSDMRMMAMSLHDRELAAGLERLGKEAEEKL